MTAWLTRLLIVLVGVVLPFRVALAAVGPCPHAVASGVLATAAHLHRAGALGDAPHHVASHHAVRGAPVLGSQSGASSQADGGQRPGVDAVYAGGFNGPDSHDGSCASCAKSCGASTLIVWVPATIVPFPAPALPVPFSGSRIPFRPYLPLDRPPLV